MIPLYAISLLTFGAQCCLAAQFEILLDGNVSLQDEYCPGDNVTFFCSVTHSEHAWMIALQKFNISVLTPSFLELPLEGFVLRRLSVTARGSSLIITSALSFLVPSAYNGTIQCSDGTNSETFTQTFSFADKVKAVSAPVLIAAVGNPDFQSFNFTIMPPNTGEDCVKRYRIAVFEDDVESKQVVRERGIQVNVDELDLCRYNYSFRVSIDAPESMKSSLVVGEVDYADVGTVGNITVKYQLVLLNLTRADFLPSGCFSSYFLEFSVNARPLMLNANSSVSTTSLVEAGARECEVEVVTVSPVIPLFPSQPILNNTVTVNIFTGGEVRISVMKVVGRSNSIEVTFTVSFNPMCTGVTLQSTVESRSGEVVSGPFTGDISSTMMSLSHGAYGRHTCRISALSRLQAIIVTKTFDCAISSAGAVAGGIFGSIFGLAILVVCIFIVVSLVLVTTSDYWSVQYAFVFDWFHSQLLQTPSRFREFFTQLIPRLKVWLPQVIPRLRVLFSKFTPRRTIQSQDAQPTEQRHDLVVQEQEEKTPNETTMQNISPKKPTRKGLIKLRSSKSTRKETSSVKQDSQQQLSPSQEGPTQPLQEVPVGRNSLQVSKSQAVKKNSQRQLNPSQEGPTQPLQEVPVGEKSLQVSNSKRGATSSSPSVRQGSVPAKRIPPGGPTRPTRPSRPIRQGIDGKNAQQLSVGHSSQGGAKRSSQSMRQGIVDRNLQQGSVGHTSQGGVTHPSPSMQQGIAERNSQLQSVGHISHGGATPSAQYMQGQGNVDKYSQQRSAEHNLQGGATLPSQSMQQGIVDRNPQQRSAGHKSQRGVKRPPQHIQQGTRNAQQRQKMGPGPIKK